MSLRYRAVASNTQAITVTNPVGGTGKYVYASGSLIETIRPTGGKTRYGYDAAMRASTITDLDGDTTYTTHDAHNNVTSTTTCAAVNTCQTAYTAYYENLPNPLDPRNDKPTDERDARSSSPYDPAYDTRQITGVSTTAGGKMLALNNQHNDLSGTFTAAGTAMASSVTYDPWGQVLASAGPAIQVAIRASGPTRSQGRSTWVPGSTSRQ
jgi:YD repeat-containing protein